ncbi:DUF4240 domain-containing protein [Planococcus sp. CAU13]|uniref:DUF4240 domain-containing protein n=1 Tax=Planococcus sp. CAU13 TaxID=1541197 RepID=UPI00052FFAA3|nr:DUF4240 domain-containing protein [Planococcus sp. CAU13]
MEKSLVCKNLLSNKFWKIKVQENFFIVSYGKVGTAGSINTKEFESAELCLREAEKLIQSKLKKGYREMEAEEEDGSESRMTEKEFWELLSSANRKSDDWYEQLEWLQEKLAKRSVNDIIRFDYLFNQIYQKSYTSDLWAAAYIIMGGCSDDSFDYFRAWLVFLGLEAYEKALANPESIIPYLNELEEGDVPEFEDFLYCAGTVFEEKTGLEQDDYLNLYWKLSGDENKQPEMEFDWDEDDEEGLRKKFPLLWELYGENPMG